VTVVDEDADAVAEEDDAKSSSDLNRSSYLLDMVHRTARIALTASNSRSIGDIVPSSHGRDGTLSYMPRRSPPPLLSSSFIFGST
jgi:hypothetical protein